VGPGAVLSQPRPTLTLRGIRQERKIPLRSIHFFNNTTRLNVGELQTHSVQLSLLLLLELLIAAAGRPPRQVSRSKYLPCVPLAQLALTQATPCVEVWQTSNLQWLRLGEEKKERKKKIEQTTG